MPDYDQEVFLMSVLGNVEAGMIQSLLESYGIPVLKKYKSAGGAYMEFYMGMSAAGIDLYVPSKLLKQARNIVNGEQQEADEEIQGDVTVEPKHKKCEDKYIKKRRVISWTILLFIISGIVWSAISYIGKLIRLLLN